MRSRRLLTAVGLASAVLLAAMALARTVPVPLKAQPRPPGPSTSCGGVVTGTLAADTIRVCDTLTMTVRVEPRCQMCPGGMNVVFVQAGWVENPEWEIQESLAALQKLENFADSHAVPDGTVKVGVVHYNFVRFDVPKVVLRLTPQLDRARGLLNQVREGIPHIGPASQSARAAVEMIVSARQHAAPGSEEGCDYIIFFGGQRKQPEDVRRVAQLVYAQNITLFVGCPFDQANNGGTPLCTVPRQLPRSSQYYSEYNDHGKIARGLENDLNRTVGSHGIRDILLSQSLPSGLSYIDGSASIAPIRITTDTLTGRTTLGWEWLRVPTAAQTVTYSAKPLAEGLWPIEGAATIVDVENKSRDLPMPSRPVTVSGLCLPPPTETATGSPPEVPTPTQTPTEVPPPTRASTLTPTPTRTDAPTPTLTPTPEPQPIYLPITLSERCTIQWVYSDVVLVMDMSTSMNQRIGGRTKLEATLDAAEQFLSIMDFTPDTDGRSDRVAVVGFNAKAWIEAGLTNDVGLLREAIQRLTNGQDQFTRMDLGFETGLALLRPALGQPNTTPVMVLLTDGLPNRVPPDPEDGTMETTVRKAAQKVKDAGARVYTIGIGLPEDINGALMRQCATLPANYFYTPDPEALAGIYARIAYSFGCPTGRHDWGRPWP